MAQGKNLEEEVSMRREDRRRDRRDRVAHGPFRMASSRANVNDILASFFPVRDIGE
jgi:hypothetical protein